MLSKVNRHEPSGVLVLNVWIEPSSQPPVRARITSERDLDAERRVSVVAVGVPQIVEVVRSWVEEFAQTGGS
jgi:hypothetical protein